MRIQEYPPYLDLASAANPRTETSKPVQRQSGMSIFTERIDSAIEARLHGDTNGARSILKSICEIGTPPLKESVPRRREAAILARDKYTCRYCGYRLLSLPVLRAIHELFPETLRWHPNWKTSECGVAWWRDAASIDHVVPATREGTNAPENLVASCWTCNASKGNLTLQELGIALLPVPDSEWDGASGRLSALVQLLSPDNRFKRYFTDWDAAIRNPERIST
jgi:5-methylcytosine-specific restriction endonuclease McrA